MSLISERRKIRNEEGRKVNQVVVVINGDLMNLKKNKRKRGGGITRFGMSIRL